MPPGATHLTATAPATDGSTSEFSRAIPISSDPPPLTPSVLGLVQLLPDDQFQFNFTAIPNRLYRVDVSTNLTAWLELFTTNAPAAVVEIVTLTSNHALQFFRVISLP